MEAQGKGKSDAQDEAKQRRPQSRLTICREIKHDAGAHRHGQPQERAAALGLQREGTAELRPPALQPGIEAHRRQPGWPQTQRHGANAGAAPFPLP